MFEIFTHFRIEMATLLDTCCYEILWEMFLKEEKKF